MVQFTLTLSVANGGREQPNVKNAAEALKLDEIGPWYFACWTTIIWGRG